MGTDPNGIIFEKSTIGVCPHWYSFALFQEVGTEALGAFQGLLEFPVVY